MLKKALFNSFKQFSKPNQWHHTTILALKRNGQTIIAGDGQVTQGNVRVKTDGLKIRKISDQNIYCGFAGSLADAFTLMQGLQTIMNKYPTQTLKSCITYAKQWRSGKMLRHLQATLIVIDKDLIVQLDGSGNVLQISDTIGVGSGGNMAQCAARALLAHTTLNAQQIVLQSMKIAAQKCIFTSDKVVFQKIS